MEQPRKLQSVAEWFLTDPVTGRVRLTGTGRSHMADDLARLGYDPNRSFGREEMHRIIDERFAMRMQAFGKSAKGRDPELDAILSGLPGWDEWMGRQHESVPELPHGDLPPKTVGQEDRRL